MLLDKQIHSISLLTSYDQPAARMRPSSGFGCSKSVLQLTCPGFDIILNLTFVMQVVFSAILSRLLSLQLGFEHFSIFA